MEANRPKSFTFFESFFEAKNLMSDEDRLAYYDALVDYAFTGKENDIDGVAKIAFITSKPNIESSLAKRKASEKGNLKRWDNHKEKSVEKVGESQKETCDNPNKNKNKKKNIEVEEEENKKGDSKGGQRFTPPTREQVKEYIEENGYDVDCEAWYDHYTSNGWKVGRTKMTDWRAAVRTWTRNAYGGKRKTRKADEDWSWDG